MYLQHLYPKPVSVQENEDILYRFGSTVMAVCTTCLPTEQIERMKGLWNRFTQTRSALTVTTMAGDDLSFTIGQPGMGGEIRAGDRYALWVDEGGVRCVAAEVEGLFDGFKTLLQLLCPLCLTAGAECWTIASAEIHDSPAIPFRGIHLCLFPETSLYNIEKAIHLAGFCKLTHVILEFWGTFPYTCMPSLSWEGKTFSKEAIANLVALAKSYGMEVIPMINHFGHASQSRACFGRHTVLNRDPSMALLFEPDGWTWCLSNPDTYQLLGAMRAEQMEICGEGKYFHLGFDEAYSFATCPLCRKKAPHELLAEYLNRLTADLVKEGRRPIVWGDEFMDRADFVGKGPILPEANGQNHGTAPAIDLLDKRIIIADWEYHYKNNENLSTPYFQSHGFDVLLCPWNEPENVRSLCQNAKDMGTMGVLLTTWDRLSSFQQRASQVTAYAWNGGESAVFAQTEAACLLRTLYDCQGRFDPAGWHYCEVIQ